MIIIFNLTGTPTRFEGTQTLDANKISALIGEGIWNQEDLDRHDLAAAIPFTAPAGMVPVGPERFELIAGAWHQIYDVESEPSPEPARLMVAKSVVQQRIIDAGQIGVAFAILQSDPAKFARWFAPDHPAVYCDDPDAIALVAALGLEPEVIMAPEI